MNVTLSLNDETFSADVRSPLEVADLLVVLAFWLAAVRSAPPSDVAARLASIDRRLADIHQQGVRIMTAGETMLAALKDANSQTNEIAADIEELKARLSQGTISAEEASAIQAELDQLVPKLKDIAAAYTPDATAPSDPNAPAPNDPNATNNPNG